MFKKQAIDTAFIPKTELLFAVHRDSARLNKKRMKKKKRTIVLLSSIVLLSLTVAAYPLAPLFVYETGGSEAIFNKLIKVPLGMDTTDEIKKLGLNGTEGVSANASNNEGTAAPSGGSQGAPAASGYNADASQNPIPEGNVLVIPKINVYINIIESNNAEWAWDRGAWHDPSTSTPEQGSNTVLSAHRFRYRPPYKATFYLLDKLEDGDLVYVYWEGKKYTYRVNSEKVVSPSATEVLNPTERSIITLITCDPLFSTENRLIVTAELINTE